jgi:hypothetical protein
MPPLSTFQLSRFWVLGHLEARPGFETERFRYKSGTLHEETSQLDENKDEKLVPGVGVEPT